MRRTPQQLRQAAWHCRRLAEECDTEEAKAELLAKAAELEREAWNRPAEPVAFGMGRC